MGRPPTNGGPAFRFIQTEVAEMDTILQEHNNSMPAREVLVALADKFSESAERKGKIVVQMKQVWNWFQNRRYSIRAKSSKTPGKLNVTPMQRRDDLTPVRNMPHPMAAPIGTHALALSVTNAAGRGALDNSVMEFEARSSRDRAWYDVANFLSHRSVETGDPEVLVRFAGFGPNEDEWINIRKLVRRRSLPCETSECVAVLPGDLILCFQEGKEQALYFDAHVLDAQRRRHDIRGCRCRFLVRYDHDHSEEIVPLRKICRRPETDFRLQHLYASNELAPYIDKQQKKPNEPVPYTDKQQKKPNADPPVIASGPPRIINLTGEAFRQQVDVSTAVPGFLSNNIPTAMPAPALCSSVTVAMSAPASHLNAAKAMEPKTVDIRTVFKVESVDPPPGFIKIVGGK